MYFVQIGQFWSTKRKIILESFLTVSPELDMVYLISTSTLGDVY